jgi:hypothetical protein
MRDFALAGVAVAAFLCSISACSDNDTPRLGPYDGLVGHSPGDAAALQAGEAGGGSGGGGSSEGGSSCSVSWKSDIWTNMIDKTKWSCNATSSCHSSGGTGLPTIAGADSHTDYEALVMYMSTDATPAVPVIKPGDTNESDSELVCVISTTNCGPQMPAAPLAPLSSADQASIKTWVDCGAPEN